MRQVTTCAFLRNEPNLSCDRLHIAYLAIYGYQELIRKMSRDQSSRIAFVFAQMLVNKSLDSVFGFFFLRFSLALHDGKKSK